MSADPHVTSVRGDTTPSVVAAPTAGGRYVLGEEIARGGMGAVFRATDTVLGREVAVKVLQERFAPDGGTARRFADEARIAAQLQHPGIPPVHDFGTLPDGRPFLAMKLIKGETLDALLARRPDPSADRGRFVAAFEAVCQAVAYAHARDVIHRDLKPANVMVGAFGEVQVMDWGLAKVLASRRRESPESVTLPEPATTDVRSLRDSDGEATQAGAVLGTPAYMAPEQAAGAVAEIDARSDVFGLGGILATVLTGAPPFQGDTAEATRVKAAQGKVDDCFARLDGCGAEPELVALCKRCLSPTKADRPPDAGEVAAAVAYLRAEAEARAREAELDRVKAKARRTAARADAAEARVQRFIILASRIATVILVFGVGAAVVAWGVQRAERRAEEDFEQARNRIRAEYEDKNAESEADRHFSAAATALREGNASGAESFLRAVEIRSRSPGADARETRLRELRRDAVMLRRLNQIGTARWGVGGRTAATTDLLAQWAEAFREYQVVPGLTESRRAAERISASPIRVQLIAALDRWLAVGRGSPGGREAWYLVAAADPDPFRSQVRESIVAGDRGRVASLDGRLEWGSQPAGLILSYAEVYSESGVPVREFLNSIVTHRPGEFDLLMALGRTYPTGRPDGAGNRVRWYQAAAALRPDHPVARHDLGDALADGGDWAGAEAAYREAVRFAPRVMTSDPILLQRGLDARFAGQEGAHDILFQPAPQFAITLTNLGDILRKQGRYEEAIAAYRAALDVQPNPASARDGLNYCLRVQRGEVPTAPPPRAVSR